MKYVAITDFLTAEQIDQAWQIYQAGGHAKEIAEKVIQPNMAEINRKLGQENDPLYLAYACEYVFSHLKMRDQHE